MGRRGLGGESPSDPTLQSIQHCSISPSEAVTPCSCIIFHARSALEGPGARHRVQNARCETSQRQDL
eukprot:8205239-Pyramimonas_sp.AAC.1